MYGFDSHDAFAIDDIEVRPFPVPHDAREPVQFVLSDGRWRLGVLTDLGVSTAHVEASLSGCDALVLECNHDLDMLANGDYPYPLKQRIAGKFGHLDNDAAAALLSRRSTTRGSSTCSRRILTQQNNTPRTRARGAGRRAQLRARLDRHRRPARRVRLARIRLLRRRGHGKTQELYRGKAKTVYTTDDPHLLVMHYPRRHQRIRWRPRSRSSTQKGETNNKINAFIMGKLAAAGVATHFVRLLNERDSLVRALKMMPVECVVRNVCAGSMAKRYGIAEGHARCPSRYSNSSTRAIRCTDPLVNDDHIRVLGWASAEGDRAK